MTNNKQPQHFYWTLFSSAFCLSAFTFGGGFVIVPLMKKRFCDELGWVEEEEMLNLAAIAQSSPGAVAVNAAILLGHKLRGFRGAAVAIVGTVLPPLLILSAVSVCYDAFRANPLVAALLKGMQAGVAAVIADVVLNLGGAVVREKSLLSLLTMLAAFAATYFLHINVALIVLACGAVGAARTLLSRRAGKGA